jgi:hypothetical protein
MGVRRPGHCQRQYRGWQAAAFRLSSRYQWIIVPLPQPADAAEHPVSHRPG